MAYTLVQTVNVTSSVSNIEFTNIPQTGKDLLVTASLRSSHSGVVDVCYLQVNNNTSSVYSSYRLAVLGSTVSVARNPFENPLYGLFINGNTSTSNAFSNGQFYLANYTNNLPKLLTIDSAMEQDTTTAYWGINAGSINTTSAITSIKLTTLQSANFLQYSSVSLYIIS